MEKLALCIGINDYPGTGSDLSGCVNDAKDYAKALTDRGFAVTTMFDGDASKEGMMAAIRKTITQAKTGDIVVLTYSGHGTFVPDTTGDEPDGRDEALCPHDIAQNRPLLDDELYDLFAERSTGVKLVFLSDSCHSGTVTRVAPPGGGAGEKVSRIRFLPPESFIRDDKTIARVRALSHALPIIRPHNCLLMAGCQDKEYSYDAWFGGRANGAFTYAAIQALSKLSPQATYRDWYNDIRKSLPSSQHPQTPKLYGSRSQKKWPVFK
jgi:hypothetical protein